MVCFALLPKNSVKMIPILPIYPSLKLEKGFIFGLLIFEMWSKWSLDAFNMNLIYFEYKRLILIFKYFRFFGQNQKHLVFFAYF